MANGTTDDKLEAYIEGLNKIVHMPEVYRDYAMRWSTRNEDAIEAMYFGMQYIAMIAKYLLKEWGDYA